MNHPIVFLDKDGTLIEDIPFNVDPERIVLKPGAAQGLRHLYEAGFRFIVVSNQSGVARGYFQEKDLIPVEERLRELIALAAGVPLDGFYYCPHHPEGTVHPYAVSCICRKPQPGLLLRAAREKGIDLETAWMVGDILHDVEAGKRAGCRAVLIDNGSETEWRPGPFRDPDFIAPDLQAAADWILSQPNPPAPPADLQPGTSRQHNPGGTAPRPYR